MTSKDASPTRVPFSATPTGEAPDITRWAQRAVWTDRMLSTLLEDKVRGGKWHWPNAYFTKVGLWSLREAHNRFGQSLAGNY